MLSKDINESINNGKTMIFSAGQAGFIIKSASGQMLAIDLYLSDCVEPLEGHDGYKRLLPKVLKPEEIIFDCIITTHFHRDHFDADSVPAMMNNNKSLLFAAYDCKEDVDAYGIDKGRTTFVKPGDKTVCGDFDISFINCDHGTGAPQAVGVIVLVDGKIIVETGDTCLRLDRKDEYLQKGNIDALIAPINGAYGNLDAKDCVELVKALDPKITIPCHFWMFASHGGNPELFRNLMIENGKKYEIMPIGSSIVL